MKEADCIFCEIPSSRVLIEENGYKGMQCPRCGLIYISPRPSLEEILNLYGHDNAHLSAESHIASAYSKRLYAKHHLHILRSFVRGGALLEIGAGAGYFLDEARKVGFEPYALEFNPAQAAFIRNTLHIQCEEAALRSSLFEGRKFDVVYHCDVISHFFDPIAEFRKMYDVMAPGSILMFETGNLAEVDPKYFKHIHRFQYPDHLFFFNEGNLVDLLKRTGFEFVKIYRYSILPELSALQRLAGMRSLVKSRVGIARKKPQSPAGDDPRDNPHPDDSVIRPSALKQRLRNAHSYFDYLIRYKIGRLAPKKRRPQTVIVIAMKN